MVGVPWVLALLLVLAPRARAERARVVLTAVPEGLEQATRTALAPWSLRVISDATPLPSEQDLAMQRARALAAQHRAGAVVWLASAPDGHTLWLYDVRHERLISRSLALGPPLDEPGAASVALSIKTLLRHSMVAPEDQRLPPASDPLPGDPSSTSAAPDRTRPASAPSAPAPLASPYSIEYRVQARSTRADLQSAIEPRYGVGLAWWPRALDHRYGVAVHFEVGPETQIRTDELRGALLDMAISLALRRRMQVRGRIYAVAEGGSSLHFTRLDGPLLASMGRIHEYKTKPSLDIGLRLGLPLSKPDSIALAIRAFTSLRWQEHVVDGRSVLESPILDLGVGVGVSVQLK